ncbi:protein-disulfide reductase DsbD family protein [Hyphococcus sp.]|uniref:protein-disulfide reductase DsbD family protein n=1 Tax=Hyphococcus sp. TaxID=2038636 RepID=UPI003CCBAF41
MSTNSHILAFVTAASALIGSACAQVSVETDYSTTDITPETNGFAAGETTWFAVRQDLREGWHVFWVNPGDAGLPLELEWGLPEGYTAGDIDHPAPEYIPIGPLASYAHEGSPVFLVPVTAPSDAEPGEIIDISIGARWQICEEICVPEEALFSFSLPVVETPSRRQAAAPLFARARASQPANFESEATFAVEDDGYVLRTTAPDDFHARDAFFFVEPEGLVEPSAPQKISTRNNTVIIEMTPGWRDGFEGENLRGVLQYETPDAQRRHYYVNASVSGAIEKPLESGSVRQRALNIPLLLALAFFGGVILNIMPCVFPVVFIKAASFMNSARLRPGEVRRDGVYYTLGVLATFLFIGGALLFLRAGGEQLGWGFHLQSPAVVALSAYILLLVGLNLSGVFSIGGSLAGAGEGLTAKGGRAGAFFTGALAVIVAAPCIGPLLSAPMGAALMLPPLTGLGIFAVLGLGLAAPYLVLSLAPGLGRLLPAPGPWMAVFKQLLAFPVFAAAVYFIWVLSFQTTSASFGAVLGGAVFFGFAAWAFEQSKGDGRAAVALRIVSAIAVLAALAPLFRLEAATQTARVGEKYAAMSAEPFDPEMLANHLAGGAPVFLDFTAAWCVTCQFDKATIFSDAALARDFTENGVVFMVADWTVRDPEITTMLESFGASGVPLYVFYPPGGEPVVFDIPLTKKAVRETVLRTGR